MKKYIVFLSLLSPTFTCLPAQNAARFLKAVGGRVSTYLGRPTSLSSAHQVASLVKGSHPIRPSFTFPTFTLQSPAVTQPVIASLRNQVPAPTARLSVSSKTLTAILRCPLASAQTEPSPAPQPLAFIPYQEFGQDNEDPVPLDEQSENSPEALPLDPVSTTVEIPAEANGTPESSVSVYNSTNSNIQNSTAGNEMADPAGNIVSGFQEAALDTAPLLIDAAPVLISNHSQQQEESNKEQQHNRKDDEEAQSSAGFTTEFDRLAVLFDGAFAQTKNDTPETVQPKRINENKTEEAGSLSKKMVAGAAVGGAGVALAVASKGKIRTSQVRTFATRTAQALSHASPSPSVQVAAPARVAPVMTQQAPSRISSAEASRARAEAEFSARQRRAEEQFQQRKKIAEAQRESRLAQMEAEKTKLREKAQERLQLAREDSVQRTHKSQQERSPGNAQTAKQSPEPQPHKQESPQVVKEKVLEPAQPKEQRTVPTQRPARYTPQTKPGNKRPIVTATQRTALAQRTRTLVAPAAVPTAHGVLPILRAPHVAPAVHPTSASAATLPVLPAVATPSSTTAPIPSLTPPAKKAEEKKDDDKKNEKQNDEDSSTKEEPTRKRNQYEPEETEGKDLSEDPFTKQVRYPAKQDTPEDGNSFDGMASRESLQAPAASPGTPPQKAAVLGTHLEGPRTAFASAPPAIERSAQQAAVEYDGSRFENKGQKTVTTRLGGSSAPLEKQATPEPLPALSPSTTPTKLKEDARLSRGATSKAIIQEDRKSIFERGLNFLRDNIINPLAQLGTYTRELLVG